MNILSLSARKKPKQKGAARKPAAEAPLPWDDDEPARPAEPRNRGLWGALVRRGTRRHRGRAFAVVILILIVALGAGAFALLAGGVDFGALRGRIKQTIEANIGKGYEVEVGRSTLNVDPVLGLAVAVDDVIIRDPTGSIAADIPSTRLAIDLTSIFSRRGLVRAIEVDGATLLFSRSLDGRVQLGEPAPAAAAANPTTPAPPPAASAGSDGGAASVAEDRGGFPDLFAALQILDRGIDPAIATALRSGFKRFAMSNSTISIKDARESLPRLFLRTELGAVVNPRTGQVALTFATAGYSGRWTANAERTIDPKTGDRTLSATFSQLTLADLFPIFGQENSAVSSDIPLYGRSTVRLSESGAVTDASIRLDLGAGVIRFRNEQDFMLLDEATVRLRWDVPNNIFVVDQSTVFAGRTQALITGWIRPVGAEQDRKYEFSLESQGAILSPRDSPEPPLLTQRIAVSGVADLPTKLVMIDNAAILSPVGTVSGAGSIGFDGPTPSVVMAASLSPMPVAMLKQIWPPFIAGGARRWVLQHVQGGNLVSGKIEAAIPAGILWTGKRVRVPDDAFRMDFRMENVSFTTIGTVPAVINASGNGSLVGSTFGLDMDKGEVVTSSGKKATIVGGLFAIPDLVPRYPEARVELQMTGEAGAFGDIANADPFRALARRDIDPAGFAGSARANLSASWPLRPGITEDDIAWRVKVDVEGFSSSKPIEGHTVADGTVTIVVDRDEAAISGKAMIDGVPAAVSLAQPMNKDAPVSDGRRQIRLALGGAANPRLGGGLDEIVVGTVTATVNDLPDKAGQHYDIDLTRARLVLTFLGWTKGIGVPARLTFDLVPSGQTYKVARLNLSGTGFVMSGEAAVDKDYGIVSANIDRLALHKGDSVALTLKRDRGASVVTVRGKSFDLRGLVTQVRSPDEFRNAVPDLTLDAKIDTVIGNNQEVLRNASLLVKTRGGAVEQVDLKGSLSGTPLAASYVHDERGTALNMTSTDAGKFFRFIDVYARGIGGQIRLVGQSVGPTGPMTGVFDVTNFAVLNEPAMENVVSVPADRDLPSPGEFDPRRVPFDRMLINFTRRESMLVVDDALIAGPALGATFAGSVDFATSRMGFSGTYIPAYAFNNLFGKIPIIGIILGGGTREGLFGVTFKVDGTLSDPRLTVNALSAITPGIFRKIFEFQQAGPGATPGRNRYPSPPMR